MPYADPNKSFDTAVRHLFRHLGDGAALRQNPIVRSCFAWSIENDNDDALIGELCARILTEARLCASEDASAGLHAQGDRQYAIASAICSGETVEITRKRLKLSLRQYYRVRHQICERTTRALLSRQLDRASQIEIVDSLRLLFKRAAALSDQGLAKKAIMLLDNAWSGISLGDARFATRLELADALVSHGDVVRAGKLLDYARRHEISTKPSSVSETLSDRAALIEARLANATGRDSEAGEALRRLVKRQTERNICHESSLEALLDFGNWHCSNARFSQARRALSRARELARRLPYLAPNLQVGIALLRAYSVEDVLDRSDGSYTRFREALALSESNASMRGSLEATIGLMGYYASIDHEDAMYDYAVRALDIASQMDGGRHIVFAAAWISTTFMKTRYWGCVERLLPEAEALSIPGTLHWTFIKEAQADFFARVSQHQMAHASFYAARDAATRLGNKKWLAIVLRDLGLLLSRVGQVEEGEKSMRQAVELSEANAGAWSRSLTHRAASKVLKKEIFSALTALSTDGEIPSESGAPESGLPYTPSKSRPSLSLRNNARDPK